MTTLWNVRLIEGRQVRSAMSVTIEERRVVSIESTDDSTPPPGAIDLTGRTVVPGLIDAHCHLTSDLERSPGFGPPPHRHGEAPRPRELGYFVLAASARAIVQSGFTTVRDVGSYDDEALATGKAVDLGMVPGPRILSCGRIISATSPGGAIFGTMYREADGPWEMRAAVREQVRRGAAFVKFMATGARSVVDEDPEPAQMTQEEMAAIVDEAHRLGKRVAAHAEGLPGTRWAIEAGADSIEHGLSLHRAPELLETMASRDVVLVPTLSTFHDLAERFADEFAPSLVDQAKRQLDEAYQTVGAARRAGVTIAVGYDSGPPGASAQEILRLSEAGLTPFEAIAAATAGGATALGRTDLGSLVPGACADLLVVNGRPDEDLRLLASPDSFEFVMKDGAIVE
jgi:imidazolonepropionase-like amidohydrolase